MFCLLLCLKTFLGITEKATCFLCSRDLFAWANPQRQFKLEPFFSVFHVKKTPWQRGAHSPELLSQQLCRGSLSRHQPWAAKVAHSLHCPPCTLSLHSVCWQRSLFKPTGTWVVIFNRVLTFTLSEPLLSLQSWHPQRGKRRSGWLCPLRTSRSYQKHGPSPPKC